MLYKIDKNLELKKLPFYTRFYRYSFIFNVVFGIIFLYGSFTPITVHNTRVITETDTVEVLSYHDIELNDSSITAELVRLGCVLPNVALAQMKIETGHFKSAICWENKNIAGIRNSASPLSIGKNRGHNVYKTYKDCLKDYVRVQNKYLKNIDGHYAEAKGYIDLIKKIK